MSTAERNPGPRTTASKATATARKVSGLIKGFYAQVQEAAYNGEPIAWCMDTNAGAGPYELRRALGVFSVYPEHYATVCSAKQTGLPFMERAEGDGYANYTCSYARIGLGYAAQMQALGEVPPGAAWGGMPQPSVLIGRTTCDPGLNWFQAFSRYLGVPIHVFDSLPLPLDIDYKDEATRRRYMARYMGQIRSLLAFLEKNLGRKIDWDQVSERMALHYKARWLYYQVHELRKAIPCPMPSGDKFSCMFPDSYMLGTQEAVDFYQELYDEVKERVEHKIGVVPNEKYRLLFVGIPQWHNMAFFNTLEEAGAVFVIESTYYPEKPPEVDTSHPLEAMAQRYWEERVTIVRRAREEGVTDLRAGLVLRMAREYQVDGVVFHLVYSCRPNAIGSTYMRNILMERLQVPAFFLESDICDGRVASEAEVRSKVAEFVETVARQKERRERREA